MSLFRQLGVAAWVALYAAASIAQAPGTMWIERPVPGYRVSLAVESIANAETSEAYRTHASPAEHRVWVVVRSAAGSRPIELAQASVDVAEKGYAGVSVPLRKAPAGASGLYEARISLATGTDYRILVRVTPARESRTLEAEFPYRHHH